LAPYSRNMRIDINLASQPYQDAQRFWTYWGTGLGLLILTTLLLGFIATTKFINANHERKEIADMEAVIARFDEEKARAEATLNQPQNRVTRDRSRFLNDLFTRKAFSWTRLFEDLERVMPAHLHVVSINPDISKDNNIELKLVVGGETSEQARDLVRKMEASKRFKETQINSERTIENQPGRDTDRVTFDISALYIPSGEKETAGGVD
jgi:type IV pilus assembly protein PilN